eukprot:SAG31_NODE_7502_length_1670_cov_1.231063_1_plen_75_part_00
MLTLIDLMVISYGCIGFAAFLNIPQEHFKLVVDSVVWAFKHHERNISETGLAVCREMLLKIEGTVRVATSYHHR